MKSQREKIRPVAPAKISETLELVELGKKARIVFHDISNHLTALTLSVGDLEENLSRDTERLREYSRRSLKTREQMEYVAALLRSHIENEAETEFDPAQEIAEVIRIFSDKCVQNKISISLSATGPKNGKIKILGSRKAFGHIVTNLVTNAIDSFETKSPSVSGEPAQAKPHQPREIKIKLAKTEGGLELAVADTGCGIRPADRPKIFNRKFTTKPHGHGIGLLAVKECVESQFGGSINVNSAAGGGTVFTIQIPA